MSGLDQPEFATNSCKRLPEHEYPKMVAGIRHENFNRLTRNMGETRTYRISFLLLPGWYYAHVNADARSTNGPARSRFRERRLKESDHLNRYWLFGPKISCDLSDLAVVTHRAPKGNEFTELEQHVLGEPKSFIEQNAEIV